MNSYEMGQALIKLRLLDCPVSSLLNLMARIISRDEAAHDARCWEMHRSSSIREPRQAARDRTILNRLIKEIVSGIARYPLDGMNPSASISERGEETIYTPSRGLVKAIEERDLRAIAHTLEADVLMVMRAMHIKTTTPLDVCPEVSYITFISDGDEPRASGRKGR